MHLPIFDPFGPSPNPGRDPPRPPRTARSAAPQRTSCASAPRPPTPTGRRAAEVSSRRVVSFLGRGKGAFGVLFFFRVWCVFGPKASFSSFLVVHFLHVVALLVKGRPDDQTVTDLLYLPTTLRSFPPKKIWWICLTMWEKNCKHYCKVLKNVLSGPDQLLEASPFWIR